MKKQLRSLKHFIPILISFQLVFGFSRTWAGNGICENVFGAKGQRTSAESKTGLPPQLIELAQELSLTGYRNSTKFGFWQTKGALDSLWLRANKGETIEAVEIAQVVRDLFDDRFGEVFRNSDLYRPGESLARLPKRFGLHNLLEEVQLRYALRIFLEETLFKGITFELDKIQHKGQVETEITGNNEFKIDSVGLNKFNKRYLGWIKVKLGKVDQNHILNSILRLTAKSIKTTLNLALKMDFSSTFTAGDLTDEVKAAAKQLETQENQIPISVLVQVLSLGLRGVDKENLALVKSNLAWQNFVFAASKNFEGVYRQNRIYRVLRHAALVFYIWLLYQTFKEIEQYLADTGVAMVSVVDSPPEARDILKWTSPPHTKEDSSSSKSNQKSTSKSALKSSEELDNELAESIRKDTEVDVDVFADQVIKYKREHKGVTPKSDDLRAICAQAHIDSNTCVLLKL